LIRGLVNGLNPPMCYIKQANEYTEATGTCQYSFTQADVIEQERVAQESATTPELC